MGKTFLPKSKEQETREIQRSQTVFDKGMMPDAIPNKVAQGAVMELINARAKGDNIEGRNGSVLFSDIVLPNVYEGMTITRTGNVIVVNSGQIIDSDYIGYKFTAQNGDIMFIINIDSVTGDIIVDGKMTPAENPITYFGVNMRGVINAEYFDVLSRRTYYQIGHEIYYRVGSDAVWFKVNIIGRSPSNEESSFFNVDDNILLVNTNGIYRIHIEDLRSMAINMASQLPYYKLNINPDIIGAGLSAYSYSYSYSTIYGNYYRDRREEDAFLFYESAPYYQVGNIEKTPADYLEYPYMTDGLHRDYTQIESRTSVDDSWRIIVNFTDEFNSPQDYKELSDGEYDPYFHIDVEIDGLVKTYLVRPDFYSAYSMEQVAGSINAAMAMHDVNLACRFGSYDGENSFYFYHANEAAIISVNDVTEDTTIGFNMFQKVDDDSDPATPDVVVCLSTDNVEHDMGNLIQWFRYPEGASVVSHYSVYRSKDIFPHTQELPDLTDPRMQNNPELFALIDDIPVCKMTKGTLRADGVFTCPGDQNYNYNKFDVSDIGNTVYTLDGAVSFKILGRIKGSQDSFITDYSDTMEYIDSYFFFGSEQAGLVNCVNGLVTSTAITFFSDDVDRLIFFADGDLGVIDKVIDANTVQLKDYKTRGDIHAQTRPVSRAFYDTVNDIIQNEYLRYNPLNMRFNLPLIGASVSSINKGILMLAATNSVKVRYTSTAIVSRIGYYNAALQYNEEFESGIKAITSIGDMLCVFTFNTTHSFMAAQAKITTNEFGESVTVLPEPYLVSGTIGMRNTGSWDYAGKDTMVIITNEPSLRFFDGLNYKESLTDGLIQESYFEKFSDTVLVSYNPTRGITLWGTNAEEVDDGNNTLYN